MENYNLFDLIPIILIYLEFLTRLTVSISNLGGEEKSSKFSKGCHLHPHSPIPNKKWLHF